MADAPSMAQRRRALARMVEGGLYFFGVANLEDFEGLLNDAEQRTMLRNWEHVPPRVAAGMAEHGTQTAGNSRARVARPCASVCHGTRVERRGTA